VARCGSVLGMRERERGRRMRRGGENCLLTAIENTPKCKVKRRGDKNSQPSENEISKADKQRAERVEISKMGEVWEGKQKI